MWIDTRTEFSDSQELTVTTASTNVVDTGQNARNIGRGNPLYLVVQTEDDADNADAASFTQPVLGRRQSSNMGTMLAMSDEEESETEVGLLATTPRQT